MDVFREQDNALVWARDGERLRIEAWGRNSLRVRATVAAAIRDDLPGALLEPPACRPEIVLGDTEAIYRNGGLEARLSADGRLAFHRAGSGAELLVEQPGHFVWPPARSFTPAAGELFHLEARFAAHVGERFYGLGQHQHGKLDQKGCVVDLVQRNTEVAIPFLLSSRGYGFLWNNPAIGRVELAASGTRWVAEATPQLDYWVTAADSPAEILSHYVDATGHAPMLPDWAAGFWQCKLRYASQDELLGIAREYRRRGLPLSVIDSDFFHMTLKGDCQFDPQHWPDPAGMVRELEGLGVKLMVSVWPTVNMLSSNYETMRQRNLLIRNERGLPAHMLFQDCRPEGRLYIQFYDATHPEARAYLWERLVEGYYRHGVKVFWLDACEPEMYPMHPENLRYHLGNGLAVGNIYPMLHEAGVWEGLHSQGETEIVTLCRSAWAGSQRYGAAVWSGDIPSTFEALQKQVRAGLNVGLSGIPWWTTDIGGFHGGNVETPYFRELIVRWFQYGAFCPLFRLHGHRQPTQGWISGGPNEVWSFGDEAYGIIRELLFLRERLRPYILAQMRLASETGVPPMRPLFFDFPQDAAAAPVDDAYMFGPALLVAPVLEQGARQRRVYLPSGATWTDAWTGEALVGGRWIEANAPLERIPLYLRDAAPLPIRG